MIDDSYDNTVLNFIDFFYIFSSSTLHFLHSVLIANDLTIGWQNLNLLSHPNTTLAPQARQARVSGENLNYMTLAPQARQARPSGEILNYLLSH